LEDGNIQLVTEVHLCQLTLQAYILTFATP